MVDVNELQELIVGLKIHVINGSIFIPFMLDRVSQDRIVVARRYPVILLHEKGIHRFDYDSKSPMYSILNRVIVINRLRIRQQRRQTGVMQHKHQQQGG